MVSKHQRSNGRADQTALPAKIVRVAQEELGPLQPRMLLLRLVASLIPRYAGGRLRAALMRRAGLRIGHGTVIWGLPRMYGQGNIFGRLTIGDHALMNVDCHLDLNDSITIAPHAGLGQEVMVLTTTHHIGSAMHRAGPLKTAPVTIGAGAWIGARALILPGVTVGSGSIVAAGAVVTKNVPPNTLVVGVPARAIRQLGTEP